MGERLTVKEDFDQTIHFYADADEVAVHACVAGRGQRIVIPEHHAPLWRALKRLGQRLPKPARKVLLRPDVSLWRTDLVSVERRPLEVYQALEGRC